jgi:hypothetical protein
MILFSDITTECHSDGSKNAFAASVIFVKKKLMVQLEMIEFWSRGVNDATKNQIYDIDFVSLTTPHQSSIFMTIDDRGR